MTSLSNRVCDAIETPKGVTVAMARLAERDLGSCETRAQVEALCLAGSFSDRFLELQAHGYVCFIEGRTIDADRVARATNLAYEIINLNYLTDLAKQRTK